jgi:predicted ATPase/DNA-binding SARP family transcriptional activator
LAGEPITGFESNKVRALLVYLAVEQDRPHRRESLAGLLWPDWPDRAARGNLRHALANLRKAIGDHNAAPPFLLITRETIQFNTASDLWLDVTAFGALVGVDPTGPAGQPVPSAARQFREAIELYRGSFLEGFSLKDSVAFEDWSLLTRERLQRQVLTALDWLAAYHERRGEYERACDYVRRQVELEPWYEEAHQQLMRLLMLGGRRSAALAQYETCRCLLVEELGVEPAEETTRLYEQIRDGTLVPAPAPGRPPGPPHNLPAPLTPFVGREAMLAEIREHLRDPGCRLLGLVGPGGSGKTRLALEAATGVLSETPAANFMDGIYFVSLAPLRSAEMIVPAVAQALDFIFHEQGEPRKQLLGYLRQKTMLLILDNLEHLLSGVNLVTDILKTAPDVKIVITSRTRLNLQGEHLFPVGGMDVPDGGPTDDEMPDCERPLGKDVARYSAVRLFLQSARRVQPGFEPTGDDLRKVVRICRLVQGMPLGILLASAWVGMLTPAEIGDEISRSLDFLETDWPDVPERQRSLRAVFDHSWRLLTARERAVMQALSIFRGGFTREAARQITGASLRELKALVEKSLLQRTSAERYDVHELVWQYVVEKLDRSPATREAIRDRHSAYYTAALRQWGEDLRGARQRAALDEIEADSDNVRVAWNWTVEQGHVERLDQAMKGLEYFYWSHGHYREGKTAFHAAADRLSALSGDKADGLRVATRALLWQSNFCRILDHRDLTCQLQQKGLALLERAESAGQDTRPERALFFWLKGHAVFTSDHEQARQLYEQSLALYREIDDRWGMANALNDMGRAGIFLGAIREAKRWLEESLAIRQTLGDPRGIVNAMADLSEVALLRGQFEKAERLARESSARSQELGNRAEAAYGLLILGETLESLGKFAQAYARLEECLVIYDDLGRSNYVASVHTALGSTDLHQGRYKEARAHTQAGLALAREYGLRFRIGFALVVLGCLALAEQAYAEAHRLLQEGVIAYREIGQRVDQGWALATLGYAARGLGDLHLARQHFSEALRTFTETEGFLPLLYALPGVALLLADEGQEERAVEVYALASRYPLVANSRWFEDIAGKHIAAVAAALPPEVIAAAQERGRARDLDTAVAALLAELENQPS